MKAPKGLLDLKGQAGKMVATIKVGDEELLEYAFPAPDSPFPPAQGNISTCYVLASPGDILAINVLANAGTADVVDVEVDGILRGSTTLATSKGVSVVLIKKVCYRGKISRTGRREAAKFCEMVVKERNTKHDIQSSGATALSAVGSLVLKCWGKVKVVPNTQSSDTQATEVDASVSTDIIPNFETHVNWYDVNKHVSKDQTPPPFEIGFINGTLCSKSKGKWKGPKERVGDAVARKPGEYKLFAVFVFHLRSTADLISLGYADVPIRYAPPPPTPKPKKGKALTKGEEDHRIAELLGDNDESEAESSQQPESKFLQESIKKPHVKPNYDYKPPPRSSLQDLLAHMASGHAFHTPILGIQPSTDQNGHVDSSTTGERALSQLSDNGHDHGDAISQSTSALASRSSSLPPIFEPIERIQKIEQAQAVNSVSKSIQLTNLPVLKGLKGAPARRAWLERAAAQAKDSKPQSFDENLEKGGFSSITQNQPTADSSSFRFPNNGPGHFGQNDSFQNASTVGTPSGPRDEGRISEIKIENSFNDAASDTTGIVDPADIALSVQRSARPRADSNATEIVNAAEVDALRASVRSLGLAGENGASQSPVVAAYHTFPSPVLGSTPLSSFRISTSNESLSGLAAQQARIHWPGLTEKSQPQLQSRSQSQCQQLSSHRSWPTEGSSTQPSDHRVSTSNQHLQSTSFARQVNHYNDLSNGRNDTSFGPAFERDLQSGNTNTGGILSIGNMDHRFSMPVQDAKNNWLSPFRKEAVVPQLDKLQGNLATKRKSDYITDASPEHSTSLKRMAAWDLNKHGRAKGSNNKNASTPSTPLGTSLGAEVSTPGLVEMEQKKATAQARRDAAEEKRKVLQKKLDKALIEEKRREVRELEEQANEIERENAELEARLAVIYAQE